MISTDSFVDSAKNALLSQEEIISQNKILKYQGYTIMPAVIIDIDQDTFLIQDILGKEITSVIIQVFHGTSWHNAEYSSQIEKTDALYSHHGSKIYVKIPKDSPLIQRTIFRSSVLDFYIMSLPPIVKYEFFINAKVGCYITEEEEVVVGIDLAQSKIETNWGERELLHSEYIATLSEGDTIPIYTTLDRIFAVHADDGDTIVSIMNGFHHLAKEVKSDINIKIELVI